MGFFCVKANVFFLFRFSFFYFFVEKVEVEVEVVLHTNLRPQDRLFLLVVLEEFYLFEEFEEGYSFEGLQVWGRYGDKVAVWRK